MYIVLTWNFIVDDQFIQCGHRPCHQLQTCEEKHSKIHFDTYAGPNTSIRYVIPVGLAKARRQVSTSGERSRRSESCDVTATETGVGARTGQHERIALVDEVEKTRSHWIQRINFYKTFRNKR